MIRKTIMHNEFSLPHKVFESEEFKKLKPGAKILYCYLAKLRNRFGKEENYFWRSMDQLVEDTGMSIKTVRTAKNQLRAMGLIQVLDGKYDPSSNTKSPLRYFVNGYERPKK